MKVHTATFLASTISGLVLIGSLVFMANIYSSVQDIWSEFDTEMVTFKVTLSRVDFS